MLREMKILIKKKIKINNKKILLKNLVIKFLKLVLRIKIIKVLNSQNKIRIKILMKDKAKMINLLNQNQIKKIYLNPKLAKIIKLKINISKVIN